MATIVTGDLYENLDGKLCEIKRQMRQKEGYSFDPERLDLALQALVEGRFEAVGWQFPSVLHAADLIPEYTDKYQKRMKWVVTRDVEPSTFDVASLKPRLVLREGETRVNTETMRTRAIETKANWGLVDGKRIIAGWTRELAQKFNGKYIPLPGTELRDSGGYLRVPYLCCGGGRCVLGFGWVGDGGGGGDRFACSE